MPFQPSTLYTLHKIRSDRWSCSIPKWSIVRVDYFTIIFLHAFLISRVITRYVDEFAVSVRERSDEANRKSHYEAVDINKLVDFPRHLVVVDFPRLMLANFQCANRYCLENGASCDLIWIYCSEYFFFSHNSRQ